MTNQNVKTMHDPEGSHYKRVWNLAAGIATLARNDKRKGARNDTRGSCSCKKFDKKCSS